MYLYYWHAHIGRVLATHRVPYSNDSIRVDRIAVNGPVLRHPQ